MATTRRRATRNTPAKKNNKPKSKVEKVIDIRVALPLVKNQHQRIRLKRNGTEVAATIEEKYTPYGSKTVSWSDEDCCTTYNITLADLKRAIKLLEEED